MKEVTGRQLLTK